MSEVETMTLTEFLLARIAEDEAVAKAVSHGLVAEAYGWGRNVDPEDDAAVLAWAREYLPRIMTHAQSSPAADHGPVVTPGLNAILDEHFDALARDCAPGSDPTP